MRAIGSRAGSSSWSSHPLRRGRHSTTDLPIRGSRASETIAVPLVLSVSWASNERGLALQSRRVIPSPTDQNPCAQLRKPMDMIRQGCSVSLFQAAQQDRESQVGGEDPWASQSGYQPFYVRRHGELPL